MEKKIICFVYSWVAFEIPNLRYGDIEKINFEKIIKKENLTIDKKSYEFDLDEW